MDIAIAVTCQMDPDLIHRILQWLAGQLSSVYVILGVEGFWHLFL